MVMSRKWKYDEPKVDMSHEGECDIFNLEGKYSLESTDPRESDIPPAAALTGGPGLGPAGRGPGRGLQPRPAFCFIVRTTLTYLRRAYVSVHRYSLEVFSVSSLE